MSTMFQENAVAQLEGKLAAANKQIQTLERNHDRLGGLLAEAKGQSAAHEKRADLAELEKRQLEAKLTAAQAIVARAAEHERAANEAASRATKAESQLQKAETRAATAETNLAVANERITDLAQQVADYEQEIGPFRNLIAALDARRVAEQTIQAETERLARG